MALVLNKRSVDFFKSEAAEYKTGYQRMIRRLIDAYVDAQQRNGADDESHAQQGSGRQRVSI